MIIIMIPECEARVLHMVQPAIEIQCGICRICGMSGMSGISCGCWNSELAFLAERSRRVYSSLTWGFSFLEVRVIDSPDGETPPTGRLPRWGDS